MHSDGLTKTPRPILRRKRVLLVDDDHATRRSTRLFLEQEGYECCEAENAIEALVLLDGGSRVDVIVSDYRLPFIDGVNFLKALSYRMNGHNIRVILVSGDVTQAFERQAMEMGAFAVLSKPLHYQEFLEMIVRASTSLSE